MARSRVQTDRSNISRNRPPSGVRDPGQLYVNWPDRQIGVIDAAQDPIDLVGVRFFSEDAAYIVDEWVIQAGRAYRCTTPTGPGAFVPASWQVIGEVFEAPLDGGIYGRQSSGWTATITKVVYDAFVLATNDHLSDIDTELTTLANGISFNAGNITSLNTLKAPLASPVFTGNPTAPTPATADNDTSVATTAYVQANLANYTTSATLVATYAPLASPAFTGNPTAPTPATADNDTSVATTAFVKAQGYLTDAPNDAFTYGRRGGAWAKAHDALGVSTWVFETATATPPTAGCIRLNNATQNSATKIYISTTSATAALMERLLQFLFSVGTTFVISNNVSPGRWKTFVVTGTPVVASGYASIDIAFVAGGVDLANNTLTYTEVSGGGGGASVHIGDTAPAGPLTPGQLWWKSNSGNMFLYFDDGTSEQWVQINISTADVPVATAERKNLLVNPAMQISQENGDTAGTTNTYYMADQWLTTLLTGGAVAMQRVAARTPNGSAYRLRATVTTADAAVGATDVVIFRQIIEGSRVLALGLGTADAKPIVVRFGFKGPAGTYAVSLMNGAFNRSIVKEFVIAPGDANADTEQVVTFPAETVGTWPVDGTAAIYFSVTVMCGANYQATPGAWGSGIRLGTATMSNGMATLGNVLEVFDVGLYADPNATGVAPPFEIPSEDEALAECMRYFQQFGSGISAAEMVSVGYVANATTGVIPLTLFTPMRIPNPSVSVTDPAHFTVGNNSGNFVCTSVTLSASANRTLTLNGTATGATMIAGQAIRLYINNLLGRLNVSARF